MIPTRILVSLAMAIVTASSICTPLNGTGYVWSPAHSNQTTCDPASFAEAPNSDAADWRQCAALSSSWASENGTFRIIDTSGDGLVPILNSRGCIFGVRATEHGHGPYIVGDADVKTILKAALQDFSEGTDLAVQGSVKCNVAAGGRADLQWQIYGRKN